MQNTLVLLNISIDQSHAVQNSGSLYAMLLDTQHHTVSIIVIEETNFHNNLSDSIFINHDFLVDQRCHLYT